MGKEGERKYGEATFYFESNFDVLCNPRFWNKLVKHFTLHRFHVAEERVAKVDGVKHCFPIRRYLFLSGKAAVLFPSQFLAGDEQA